MAGWAARFAHALGDAVGLAERLGAALAGLQGAGREAAGNPRRDSAVLRLEGVGVLRQVTIGRKRNRALEASALLDLLDESEFEALTPMRHGEPRREGPPLAEPWPALLIAINQLDCDGRNRRLPRPVRRLLGGRGRPRELTRPRECR